MNEQSVNYLNSLGIPEYLKSNQGKRIKVAVLDVGFEYHRDINFKQIINFTTDNKTKSNHGNHVCGIIAGKRYGIAKEVDLYGCKVIDDNLNGNWKILKNAISWCVENKIDVINISLGGFETNNELHEIIKKAYLKNTIITCAVGNINKSYSLYPANYDETISVLGSRNVITKHSIKYIDDKVDYIVPCENIYSTCLDNKYCRLTGTSMAVPFITGIVALILSNKKCSFDEVKKEISKISMNVNYIENDSLNNYGIIDFKKLKSIL